MSKKWVISCRCREIYISLPHITIKSTLMTHAGHRAYKKVDQRNPVIPSVGRPALRSSPSVRLALSRPAPRKYFLSINASTSLADFVCSIVVLSSILVLSYLNCSFFHKERKESVSNSNLSLLRMNHSIY